MKQLLVVLGHENDPDGTLSRDAEERCKVAAALAQSYDGDYRILPTGAFGDYFNRSDSPHGVILSTYLVSLGIDPSKILPPTISSGTVDDAWQTMKYVNSIKFTGDHIDLVTSAFHIQRARYVFSRVFPLYKIRCHEAANQSGGAREALQRRHEKKRLRETKRKWVDVSQLCLTALPDDCVSNLGEEVRHYDNLSLACVTAIVVAFGFVISGSLPSVGPAVPNVTYLGCALMVTALYYLYYRFAETAASARRVMKSVEMLYGVPGLSLTKTRGKLFGLSISAMTTISVLVSAVIAILVFCAFSPPKKVEQSSGLNDYPPSRPVLGRFAPGTDRAVGQS